MACLNVRTSLVPSYDESDPISPDNNPKPKAIMWIHGYTMDSSVWQSLWEQMPGYKHVGVDLPGHGSSEPLLGGDDLNTLLVELEDIIEQHSIQHIVAISFGGIVAIELALKLRGKVASLILNSPAIGGMEDEASTQSCNLELLRLFRERGYGPWLSETWIGWGHDIFTGIKNHQSKWENLQKTIKEYKWTELGDGWLQQIVKCNQTARTFKQIDAKTLIVVGENDMLLFKRTAEVLNRSIPKVQRIYQPASGHLAFLEHPEQSARLITDVLNSVVAV